MTEPIEAEVEENGTRSMMLRKDQEQALATPERPAATSQQMRVIEVATALEPAYAKASTLELSDDEIEALMAPFPDNIVEIRPHDGLIYIPHIHISNRLNMIFKPGKWALVCRRHWLEGNIMYGEYVLLIRGCFVGESIGGHQYVSTNAKMNFSDALESTAAEALRRICGKRLSCGSQLWEPEYARQWQSRHAVQMRNGKWERRFTDGDAAPPLERRPDPDWMKDDDQIPGAEVDARTPQGDNADLPLPVEKEAEAAMGKALEKKPIQKFASGVLERLAEKPTKKRGGVRYGVMLDGERWYNHFSATIQENATALKGSKVNVSYFETQYGNDLTAIDPAIP